MIRTQLPKIKLGKVRNGKTFHLEVLIHESTNDENLMTISNLRT